MFIHFILEVFCINMFQNERSTERSHIDRGSNGINGECTLAARDNNGAQTRSSEINNAPSKQFYENSTPPNATQAIPEKKIKNPNTIELHSTKLLDDSKPEKHIYDWFSEGRSSVIIYIYRIRNQEKRISGLLKKLQKILKDRTKSMKNERKKNCQEEVQLIIDLNYDGIEDEIRTYESFIRNANAIICLFESLSTRNTPYSQDINDLKKLCTRLQRDLSENDAITNKFRVKGYFMPPSIQKKRLFKRILSCGMR